jgi:hypothetical protein
MNYRIAITLILLVTFPGLISGQSFSEKRSIRKSLIVNKETTLEVNNKYGTIHINTWQVDSVSIRAEIEASASTLTRLEKMFDGVNVNISETTYIVRAHTYFTQNINMLFESFKGMTNKIIAYDSKIEINYFISAPEYLNIKIENKYGDVYMEDNSGTVSINLSNGSFKANSLNNASDINLTFCDASINRINDGNIDASFSELVIDDSKRLTINSVSSRFDLKTAGRIDTKSRRDKFFIGSVESLSGNAYFTDYRIAALEKEISLVPKYGSINADLIKKGVELVSINSGFTDISLTFDPSASYNLDIRHVNVFLVLPDKNAKIERKTINEDKKEYMTFGSVGKNPSETKVIIDSARGNILIK